MGTVKKVWNFFTIAQWEEEEKWLNEMARNGKLDPVIGRDREIERVTEILCRRTKNNLCSFTYT